MNMIALSDLIHAANEAQSITHAISVELTKMADGSTIGARDYLTLMAAAAELASDRIIQAVECAKEIN